MKGVQEAQDCQLCSPSSLTNPVSDTCDVCRTNYDRIVKFESFDEDVRDILRARGLGWLPLSHLNSHGHNKEVKADNVTSLFRDVPPALTR